MALSWEIAALIAIAAGAAWLAGRRLGPRSAAAALALPTLVAGLAGAALIWEPPERSAAERAAPPRSEAGGYVSSDACRPCHAANYDSWQRSFHRTMTQVASRETIQAAWRATEVSGRGRTLRIEIRGDEMWADDVDGRALVRERREVAAPPAAPRRRAGPIVMTTGSHHMQIYWIRGVLGLYHQLTWAWLTEDARWVPVEDVYAQPHEGTTGIAPGFWNTNCIHCHSTGPEPRLSRTVSGLAAETRAGELGIACEACHGPGERHVTANHSPLRRYLHHLTGRDDPTIVNPEDLSPERASEVCAQCHAVGRRLRDTDAEPYRPGGVLARTKEILTPAQLASGYRLSYYAWPDGTTRVTGREHNALIESACFSRGAASCLSCHSLHRSDPDDQLAWSREGDAACLACHDATAARIEEHSHHAEGSPGASCLNCHMPNTTYGLLKITRSHRIDSPEVRGAGGGARPNACNLCHLDRTLEWTALRLAEWYGRPVRALDTAERTVPAGPLWLVRGDAVQRATAAWHFGWEPAHRASGGDWQAAWLARSLDDPYASVRYLAGRALARQPGFEDFRYDYLPGPEDQGAAVRAALARAPGAELARLFDALRASRDDTAITVME